MTKATLCKDAKLKKQDEKEFEYHRDHYDIFYVTKGSMMIILGDQLEKTGDNFKPEKDFGTSGGSVYSEVVILQPGQSLVVPPLQLHKPGLIAREFKKDHHKECDFILVKVAKEDLK